MPNILIAEGRPPCGRSSVRDMASLQTSRCSPRRCGCTTPTSAASRSTSPMAAPIWGSQAARRPFVSRETESLQTRRWRETDSNSRSHLHVELGGKRLSPVDQVEGVSVIAQRGCLAPGCSINATPQPRPRRRRDAAGPFVSRDRGFADSPLEEIGFELVVPCRAASRQGPTNCPAIIIAVDDRNYLQT